MIGLSSRPQFGMSIFGKGTLEIDSVCIIGSQGSWVREFDLTLKTDETAAEDWAYIKANLGVATPHGDQTPEQRLRQRIFEQLDERAPTAVMLPPMKDDPELGIKGDHWSMEVQLPADVMRQFEDDLLGNRTGRIQLGIRWVGGLVLPEHAPPAFPTTWGLLRVTENADPEPLRGHVESIQWVLRGPARDVQLANEFEQIRQQAVDRALGLPEGASEDLKRAARHSQLHSLLEGITEDATRTAITEREDVDRLRWETLPNAIKIVEDIRVALTYFDRTNDVPEFSWKHEQFPLTLIRNKKAPVIDRAWLEDAARAYLESPFRSQRVDRLLVDALVATEVYGFGDEIWNVPNLPFLSVSRKAKHLMQSMLSVYSELRSNGFISAQHIRERAQETSKEGVIWPSTLFVVLDDIIARTGRF